MAWPLTGPPSAPPPDQGGGLDLDDCISRLVRPKPELLPERLLKMACQRLREILIEENNVQPVHLPVVICGDIHGQFFDLLELFNIGGQIPEKNYVFMGDFVDRGYNSVETFELLMLLKVRYPACITLLRGISAIVENSVFCVHGGLSPDVKLLDQIRTINRVQEIPNEGAFGDLVWSDPEDVDAWAVSPRGAGWLFGERPTAHFNRLNGLDLICRAHQLVQEGYKYMFLKGKRGQDGAEQVGMLATVWSAPNYCYRCGNVASILDIDEQHVRNFRIFSEVPASAAASPPRQLVPYFL